jgi:outer membrane lipoprotein-sorting protein
MMKGFERMKSVLKMVAVVLALGLVSAPTAFVSDAFAAKKVQSIAVTPEMEEAAGRINSYFNSFETMKGDFVQTSPRGRTTRGVMHLAKPGKLRFEYEPPNPLLIAADGKWLTIKNKDKEKGDQVPLSSTPLRLIVAPKLNLLQEAAVLNFEQAEGFTTFALADKKGRTAGQIILVFDDNANELRQWIIVDGKGQKTTVELANLQKNVKMNPKLFQVTINRKERE